MATWYQLKGQAKNYMASFEGHFEVRVDDEVVEFSDEVAEQLVGLLQAHLQDRDRRRREWLEAEGQS